MSQANVSRGKAVQALRSNGMDIVNAIMVLKSLMITIAHQFLVLLLLLSFVSTLFSVFFLLKDEKLIKMQTYTKTEAYKLYSRVF